jgi:hypothetical protein
MKLTVPFQVRWSLAGHHTYRHFRSRLYQALNSACILLLPSFLICIEVSHSLLLQLHSTAIRQYAGISEAARSNF